MITRRGFLQSTTAMAMAATAMPRHLLATDLSPSIELPELGRLTPLHSNQITSSPFSVGFETLDRKGFDPRPTYEPLGKLGIKWARVQTGWCGGAPDEAFKSAGFVRNSRALYAWWSPISLFEDFTPTKVTLRLPTLDNATIDNPVLVDPLSQRVSQLSGKMSDGVLTVAGVPLLDCPLLVTDRSVVPLSL
jgi:hypothetical protein